MSTFFIGVYCQDTLFIKHNWAVIKNNIYSHYDSPLMAGIPTLYGYYELRCRYPLSPNNLMAPILAIDVHATHVRRA